MKQNLLKEMEAGSKNALLKKRIITHYIYNGSSTITDLAKELDLSVPTTTKFINALSGLFHNEFKLRLGLFLIKE